MVAEIVDTSSTVVDYPAPVVGGGSAPVTSACTVASGSTFNAGTTDVVCTATDSAARTSQCVFRVTVAVTPKLKGTKIVAFGDSITWGEVSPAVQSSIQFYDAVNNYPSVMRDLLAARYKAQEITVVNEGIAGEKVLFPHESTGITGEARIERVAVDQKPDVLIVLEGVNGLGNTTDAELISAGLRRGVRRAVQQGVPLVLISTILPGVEGRFKAPNPAAVKELNDGIRGWASLERAILVDNFSVFDPSKASLIGEDGLHPNLAGYKRLAEVFFDVIKNHFERPLPSGPNPPSAPLFTRPERRW